MKSKLVGYLILTVGICFIGYASWGIIQSNVKANDTLEEAKKIVESNPMLKQMIHWRKLRR